MPFYKIDRQMPPVQYLYTHGLHALPQMVRVGVVLMGHARLVCRFTAALTKSVPPFKAWKLPAALGSLLPWQKSSGAAEGSAEANLAALAGLPYTYPDVLPKACAPCSSRFIKR